MCSRRLFSPGRLFLQKRCWANQRHEQGLTLTVEVDNWANVSPATLKKAQVVVGKILAEAGVKLGWVDCPCEKPRPDATTLSLRIIPKLFGSTSSTFRSDHLGFAAVTAEGGVLATVFYDRIQSAGKGGDLSNLLGLATAHELGHLLLGSKAHTDEGIMRPRWTRKHLHRNGNDFRFSLEQSQAIRWPSKPISSDSKCIAVESDSNHGSISREGS